MKSIHLTALAAAFLFSTPVFAAPVNINTASASEIAESLQGIGQNKAQAIVEYRNNNGPFNDAVDVVQVKGIGNATYDRNKADIRVK